MTYLDQFKFPAFSLTKAGRRGIGTCTVVMGVRRTNKYKNKDKNPRDIKAPEQENISGINRCYLYTFGYVVR